MAFEFLLFQNFTLTCKTIFRQLVYRQKLSCSVFKDSFRDDERGKVLFKRSVCSCNYKKDNFDPKAAQLTAWFKWHRGAVVCRALCKWHTGRLTKTVCLGPDKKGGKNDPGYKLYWLPVLFCKRQTGRFYIFLISFSQTATDIKLKERNWCKLLLNVFKFWDLLWLHGLKCFEITHDQRRKKHHYLEENLKPCVLN